MVAEPDVAAVDEMAVVDEDTKVAVTTKVVATTKAAVTKAAVDTKAAVATKVAVVVDTNKEAATKAVVVDTNKEAATANNNRVVMAADTVTTAATAREGQVATIRVPATVSSRVATEAAIRTAIIVDQTRALEVVLSRVVGVVTNRTRH